MTNNISLNEKIKLLKVELDNIDNEICIDEIFSIINKTKVNNIKNKHGIDNKIPTENKIVAKKIADKKDGKYIVLLKLLNNILTNLGKSNIANLTEFQNVDRDDLIKEENINSYNQMEKELFIIYINFISTCIQKKILQITNQIYPKTIRVIQIYN